MSIISAQDVKAKSQQVKPFWLNALQHFSGRVNTYFSLKLCYLAHEFTTPVMSARVFPFELEHDSYFELVNFSFEGLEAGQRQLHCLPYKPLAEWQRLYPHYPNANGGTYLIPLTEFKLVHSQPLDYPAPFAPVAASAPVVEEPAYPTLETTYYPVEYTEGPDLDDMSTSNMTLRDQYAITHSVPVSNTPWVNRMIEMGNAMKREQEVQTAKAIQEYYLAQQNS